MDRHAQATYATYRHPTVFSSCTGGDAWARSQQQHYALMTAAGEEISRLKEVNQQLLEETQGE